MMKTRESNFFRSNRLRQFVLKYDARRQSDDHRIQFDDLVLPPELAAILKPDVLTPGGQVGGRTGERVGGIGGRRGERVDR